MGLDDRLKRLEGSQPPEECPRCHDRQYVVFVRGEPRPEPCPKCGKTAQDFVIEANSEEGKQMVERVLSGQLPAKSDERKAEIDLEGKDDAKDENQN